MLLEAVKPRKDARTLIGYPTKLSFLYTRLGENTTYLSPCSLTDPLSLDAAYTMNYTDVSRAGLTQCVA